MDWDKLIVGDESGRVELHITNAMIDAYLGPVELDFPMFKNATVENGRIAPPDMIPKLAMPQLYQVYLHRLVGPNMRIRQEFKFLAPMRVGMTVTGVARLLEKFERKGRRYITFEAIFTDERGNRLAIDRRNSMLVEKGFSFKKEVV